jgi:hypothetical protein
MTREEWIAERADAIRAQTLGYRRRSECLAVAEREWDFAERARERRLREEASRIEGFMRQTG